jgi:hypothetical protein
VVASRIEPGISGYVARNSDHWASEAVLHTIIFHYIIFFIVVTAVRTSTSKFKNIPRRVVNSADLLQTGLEPSPPDILFTFFPFQKRTLYLRPITGIQLERQKVNYE